MYRKFFHLQFHPFNNSPDPRFLLRTDQAREVLGALRYGITTRKGFTVVTGEPGTGKTTLVRYALSSLDESRILTSFVFNPLFDILDFLEFVMSDFGVQPTYRTKASMLIQFNRWLVDRYVEGKTCVVVIDEAQHLSWELLEEVRLLTNLETSNEKLLQVVLSGQPELEDKLRQDNARQLRQRITLSCRTYPLRLEEVGPYIEHRLDVARAPEAEAEGAALPVFPPAVLEIVHEASHGIPRVVNLICEHALIYSYADRQREITEATIRSVLADLEIDGVSHFSPTVDASDTQAGTVESIARSRSREDFKRNLVSLPNRERKREGESRNVSRLAAVRRQRLGQQGKAHE